MKQMNTVGQMFAHESAGGIFLVLAAVLALVAANTPAASHYQALLDLPVEVRIGPLELAKPALLWVNDGWMAVFFFLVGLEIKRELLEGHLASKAQAALPAVAAIGGMAVPALIYVAFNRADAIAVRGWAIPAATDIAFALGVITLLGPRVPTSLKVFLTAIAIIDDLGAIVVIALFYTAGLDAWMLSGASLCLGALILMNRSNVTSIGAYAVVGIVLWVFVLKSGVHATLAGVATGLCVPLRVSGAHAQVSPLRTAEHALHTWVAFLVLPVFAFMNAGVSMQGLSFATLLEPIPLGVACGLVVGKTIGVFATSWLLVRLKIARLPHASTWFQMLGTSMLCGIGFTMSLFIGGLAFIEQAGDYESRVKLGVLAGSLIAAAIGALVLLGSHRAAVPGATGLGSRRVQ